MANAKYVLKTNGKVSRILEWNARGAVHVVLLKDDQRLELVTSLSELDKSGVRYEVIKKITKTEVKKSPVTILPGITVEFESAPINFERSAPIVEDSPEIYEKTLKWSAIGHVALILLIFLTGFIINKVTEKDIEIVQVAKQIRPVKKVAKNPPATTSVSRKKIKKRSKKAKYAHRQQKKRSYKSRKGATKKKVAVRKTYGSKGRSASNRVSRSKARSNGTGSGALAALETANKKLTGANLKNLGRSGVGYGKGAGKGTRTKSLYGRGLQKSSYGNGKKVGRYRQGYSTRGVGGGGSAKYGEYNIKGGGGNYLQPLYTEALIQGGLDRSLVDAVIRRNQGKFTYCYEKGLQRKPNLSGRVSVFFVINPSGRVSTANIKSTSLNYRSVESCIIAQMKSLKFPKPVGNLKVKVTYPFQLQKGYLARR